MTKTYDFVAVGLGPFNLGLAALTEPLDDLDGVFLERRPEFNWHPGMLLDDATVQTPFLADLVTLADPTSRFSFLNHAKRSGHLYGFYIRETFQPLRSEFNDYCRWVASELQHMIRYERDVFAVERDPDDPDVHLVHARVAATGERETYRARALVTGTGPRPHVPPGARGAGGVHSSDYLPNRDDLVAADHTVVVGGGQSAAEIFHDLLLRRDDERDDGELTWVTRSPRFFPLEYTKLTLELTSPEYLQHFHGLPEPQRDALVRSQAGLYKGIDGELVNAIFDLLYRRARQGRPPARLLTCAELVEASDEGALTFNHMELDERFTLDADALVLATGFTYATPPFLAPIRDRLRFDARDRLDVRRDYSVQRDGPPVYVQNGELHTHGFVAPDLGMACFRNSIIIRELLGDGREPYAVEERIAFQEFGTPAAVAAVAR
jgi:lysine N6-hydroxylase